MLVLRFGLHWVLWRFVRVVLGCVDCVLWVFIVFDWLLMRVCLLDWLTKSYWFSIFAVCGFGVVW